LKERIDGHNSKITSTGEIVEKVPKQILGGDTEKNDFTECATIDALTIMKGRETPKNQALTILKGFSRVSEVTSGRESGRGLTLPSSAKMCY
jgi:hypothetical protein